MLTAVCDRERTVPFRSRHRDSAPILEAMTISPPPTGPRSDEHPPAELPFGEFPTRQFPVHRMPAPRPGPPPGPGYGPPPGYPPPYGYPRGAAVDPRGYPPPGHPPRPYPAPPGPAGGYGYGHGYPPVPAGYPAAPADADPTAVVGLRVGQYLIDAAICGVVNMVLSFLVGFLFGVVIGASGGSAETAGLVGGAISIVTAVIVMWTFLAWWPSRNDGRTLAMGWLGIRIVTADGQVPGLGKLSLRLLLLPIDLIPFGLVGLITMCSSSKHQRVGDMAAGTLVVRA